MSSVDPSVHFIGTDLMTISSHMIMGEVQGSIVVRNILHLQLLHENAGRVIGAGLPMSLGADVSMIRTWCSFFIYKPKFLCFASTCLSVCDSSLANPK